MKKSGLKHYIIGVSIVVLIITIFVAGKYIINIAFSKGSFVNDEKPVNNSYNNTFISDGELTLLNDELYFYSYFHGNDFRLYKINSKYGERIDNFPFSSEGTLLEPLQLYKEDLLIDYGLGGFDGTIYKLNTFTNKAEKYSTLNNSENIEYKYYKAIDDKLYVFSDNKIYFSSDGVKTEEIFSGCADITAKSNYEKMIYIKDDLMVYITKDGHLKKYDIKQKREVYSKKLDLKKLKIVDDLSNINSVFMCGDKTYLVKGLTSADNENAIYEVSDSYKKIYSGDLYTMNVYNNYIYINPDGSGIDVIDTRTYKTKNLVNTEDKSIRGIYILGDKWVYFTNDDGSLKRVHRQGGKVEKVFGLNDLRYVF
ncbi:MAG: hypothetical protein IIU39_00620 [Ruminococcus sp.]|nr:hypothetical protein [Ruminococcus sp.]